ncbi:MAG TPA: phage tail family protein [Candidatus Scybalocola faecavium]|nr:phage tail family protein [Candidatus Scybalocola faecavium]
MIYSASINGIHMLKTYNMPLESMNCVQPPEIKKNSIDIPGRNGILDLTDFFGRTFYENRTITMNFGRIYDKTIWPQIYSEVLNNFHGKRCQIIFDDDPNYYWEGRVSVDSYERTQRLGTLTITVDADPYKYTIGNTSEDDWLWDPFDLDYGVIREYGNIQVNGSLDFIVDGTPMPSVPEIEVSADMQVRFNGKTYGLKYGINKIYEIEIINGQNLLTFIGNGTVKINYKGGSL